MRNKPSTLYDEDLLVDVEQGQEELIDKRSKGNCCCKQDQDPSAERERERERERSLTIRITPE